MKNFFSFLYSFLILLGFVQNCHASENPKWDEISDKTIEVCLTSNEFQNSFIEYTYNKHKYEMRFLYNPNQDEIKYKSGLKASFQFRFGFFSSEKLPDILLAHIKEIVEKCTGSTGGIWSQASTFDGICSVDFFDGAVGIPQPGVHKENTTNRNEIEKSQLEIQNLSSADEEICNLFNAQKFIKLSLNYEWKDKSYLVHFVYNPTREYLYCENEKLSRPVQWLFAMAIENSSYPRDLAIHLKTLIHKEFLTDTSSVIDIGDSEYFTRKYPNSLYTSLEPTKLHKSIENIDLDLETHDLFISNQLVKKTLHFELNNNYSRIVLVYNPEELNLHATTILNTWENGRLNHTQNWSSKFGVFSEKKVSQELIDYVSNLLGVSWWDKMWNLSIHNGDKIEFQHNKHTSWTYTYTYPWFDFIQKAQP